MDANLSAYSTEMLYELLAEKVKKPKTDHLVEIIQAIENEIHARKKK